MQNPPSDRQTPQYPIEGVDRALRLILLFREHPDLRLSMARDTLGIGQSTAHRLMAMLVYHGFAVQDPVSRAYRAGPALLDVGLSAVQNLDLRAVARPVIESLADQVGETVHLGIPEGTHVRFIDVVESELALRVSGRVGRLLPAHATSLGKAILAAMSTEQVKTLYPREQLPPVTARTMRRRSQLLSELQRIRERGYSCNSEESEEGVASTGIAVADPARGIVGAISIAAPLSRMDKEKTARHGALLIKAAQDIQARLGGSSG